MLEHPCLAGASPWSKFEWLQYDCRRRLEVQSIAPGDSEQHDRACPWLQFMAGIHAEGVAWTDGKVDNMMVRSLELTEDGTRLKHGVTFLDFGGARSTEDGALIV